MRRQGLVALTVLVLAVISCDAADDTQPTPTSTSTSTPFTNPNARFVVAVGEDFQVVLESNVTTGYSWDFEAPLDDAVLEFVDERYEEPPTNLIGAAGRQVFDFRGIGDGSTFIQLWYIRPFDNPPDPADHAQFEVIVGTGVPDQTVDPGDIDEPVAPPPDDENAIGLTELIAGGDVTDVVVRTLLFDDGTGLVMCEVLAESFPPQCVGARVPITNPEAVDADFTQQGPIRWTDRVVVLTGTLSSGTFTIATE